jgi:hypothetical protein
VTYTCAFWTRLASPSETPVSNFQSTWHHIPENSNLVCGISSVLKFVEVKLVCSGTKMTTNCNRFANFSQLKHYGRKRYDAAEVMLAKFSVANL